MCPCGSGEIYKECCKGKKTTIIHSRKPFEVQIMEKMRNSMKKCCMYPDRETCRGKIKDAHALQNNKIISLLAGTDRHVYMMDPKKQPQLVPLENGEIVPIVEISRTSANDATTETCFCDVHDNIAFAVIEKGAPDFDESREDMKFVYAYKAFIFEYYKQWISMSIFRQNFKDNPAAFQSPDMVAMYRSLQIKMQEFDNIKQHFDTQILAGTYNGITTCAINIPFQIKFADYAYIAPNYDMNGKKIHHTKNNIMHRISMTIFPEENHSWLLMSCLDSEKEIYASLFEQLKKAHVDKLKFYLNLMLPLYSENMVLSPTLWRTWDEEIQMAYTFYANLINSDFIKMEKIIGMGLKNASMDKSRANYSIPSKINLFI